MDDEMTKRVIQAVEVISYLREEIASLKTENKMLKEQLAKAEELNMKQLEFIAQRPQDVAFG